VSELFDHRKKRLAFATVNDPEPQSKHLNREGAKNAKKDSLDFKTLRSPHAPRFECLPFGEESSMIANV